LPKGTDLSIYTQEQLDAIAFHHNAKPRKSLAWKSPAELFLQSTELKPPVSGDLNPRKSGGGKWRR
jgi:IS30 family transposase